MIHILRATRGGYQKPIPLSEAGLKWVDDNHNKTKRPLKQPCDHPKHWEWGKGTRNGQKLWYPLSKMFYQKWHLTDKQLKQAIKQYDMASLEMRGRIICKDCADKELSEKKQ